MTTLSLSAYATLEAVARDIRHAQENAFHDDEINLPETVTDVLESKHVFKSGTDIAELYEKFSEEWENMTPKELNCSQYVALALYPFIG